eukprot:454492_1
MYHCTNSIRNKYQNKYIDAKYKNKHAKSKNKLPRKSSNSLNQEFRNEKFNLQLFNRLYTNKTNNQYSLHKYLQSDNIYDDIQIILNHKYNDNKSITSNTTDTWQCNRCTYINTDGLSYCQICEQSYQNNDINIDNNSITSSDSSSSSITTHSSLHSYINHKKTKIKRKKFKQKKSKKHKKSVQTFKFNDENYKRFKKYMRKRNTSIIAYKKAANNNTFNNNKVEKRKQNANKLYQMYKTLYLSTNHTKNEIIPIITSMTSFIPKKHMKIVLPQTSNNTQCKVCYTDTNNDDTLQLISMNKYCSHCMICSDCFIQYLQITINDDENILPWLLCPAQDCKAPINIHLLFKYVCVENLYKFGKSFLYKHLQRSMYWMDCPDGNDMKCKYGWIMFENVNNKTLICDGCEYEHIIIDREEEKVKDNGFDELIAQGIMKECPQCNYPTMKDYGMCNVMHCGKCNVYWNWRTKDIGSSSNEVKQKARNNGTLWESGELAYQQNLQSNNLPEFVALLARNGIKYNPNYRRGS